jgi:tetratricopeptide (TPR) repeat protein
MLGISLKKHKKEYEKAIECYTKAIELEPEINPECYFNKAEALSCLEKYHEAVDCFNKAIQLSPFSHADFYYGKGK